MAITHTFKGSYKHGYYAYIEDKKLVIGEDRGHEGGETYRGSFADIPVSYKNELSENAPSLFNSILRYYARETAQAVIFDNQLEAMFKDIAEAPTGGVDENFNIRPLKDQFSDMFIRILAGHLVANGWVKEDR